MARAWAEIDLDAVRHNVRALRAVAAPARFCAVVKANGYGHGAAAVGRAALEAGADWLAVAQVDEAVVLRDAGIQAPLLVLAEPRLDEVDDAVATGARLTVYSSACIAAIAKSVLAARVPAVSAPAPTTRTGDRAPSSSAATSATVRSSTPAGRRTSVAAAAGPVAVMGRAQSSMGTITIAGPRPVTASW